MEKNNLFETMIAVDAFEKGGIKEIYEKMVMSEEKAYKMRKELEGENFNELTHKTSYTACKIHKLLLLLQVTEIVKEKTNRKVIADEMAALAEYIRNL